MRQFRHSFMVITTDFELEPVLQEYTQRYPAGDYKDFRIVFKTADEYEDGQLSYIVVFEYNRQKAAGLRFNEFLDAYCKVNEHGAMIDPSSTMPKLEVGRSRTGRFLGDPARYQKPKPSPKK